MTGDPERPSCRPWEALAVAVGTPSETGSYTGEVRQPGVDYFEGDVWPTNVLVGKAGGKEVAVTSAGRSSTTLS